MLAYYSLPDGLELLVFGTLGKLSHVGVDGCGDGLELFYFFDNKRIRLEETTLSISEIHGKIFNNNSWKRT